MSQTVTVGISDLNAVCAPDMLVTYALGSCVGICLYDPVVRVAGLSHIMLPDSTQISNSEKQPYRFADTAIELLIKKMEMMGANRRRTVAKIAGGAQMFNGINNSSLANIGARNVSAVEAELSRLRIPISASDVGKDYGRTLRFDASDGKMHIKSVIKGQWVY